MSVKRAALVTGASRGIGRGIALALAEKGWNVAVNYHSNAAAANDLVSEIKARGTEAFAVQADVATLGDHARLLDAVTGAFGRLDVLVNNAGIGPRVRADLLEMSVESYDEVMGVNLRGPFFLTQRAARLMIGQIQAGTIEQGTVVNIGSVSAYTASINRGEYCVAKAGMGMMTALFADRLATHGINVYEVRPGIIETDMTHVAKAKYDRLIIEEGLTPIRRWGQPEDVGRAVEAIVSGAFPFSTGEVINVDGGFHLRRL
ncbi:MAG: 3-ketoacyl-ACP reductase [Chloroflexi bacterium]|nr:3-ketoacyl-ACP reductase [Chloroflexota bacterium]